MQFQVVSTNQSESSLKDLAKQRLKSRFDVSNISSFDESVKIRKSCHLIEQVNSEFYCDCAMGSKARLCKHTVGLMLKTEIIGIDSDVRSKPLGQKRKRDRPKKLPSCLARSPEQPVRSVMTRVTSPNVSHLNSTIVGQSVSPLNTTAILSPISVMSVQKKNELERLKPKSTWTLLHPFHLQSVYLDKKFILPFMKALTKLLM